MEHQRRYECPQKCGVCVYFNRTTYEKNTKTSRHGTIFGRVEKTLIAPKIKHFRLA